MLFIDGPFTSALSSGSHDSSASRPINSVRIEFVSIGPTCCTLES
jgi:hypothetical protein